MKLEKLGKTFAKEIKRSPKKSAILGLMCLVALYYWIPLFYGFFGGDSDDGESIAGANQQTVVVAQSAAVRSQPSTGNEVNKQPRIHWDKIVHWMEQDPRRQTAHLAPEQVIPFRVASQLVVQQQQAEQDAAAATTKLVITPQEGGLELNSTLVGPRSRLAMINGRTYRLEDRIRAAKEAAETTAGEELWYTLVEIQPRRILLERKGKQFELKIEGSPLLESLGVAD